MIHHELEKLENIITNYSSDPNVISALKAMVKTASTIKNANTLVSALNLFGKESTETWNSYWT